MKKIKIFLVSLGCEKNLVDSEIILGMLNSDGFTISPSKKGADLIIINTCGFIEPSKKEAIDEIIDSLEYQKYGAKICVCGCLVQRYYDELIKEIPEVDLYVPIRDYLHFSDKLKELFRDDSFSKYAFNPLNRLISTPKYQAYVRISEGCNNCCTYCAIPLIRGSFVSRKVEDILYEIRELVNEGRYEINLISQDVTKYGIDIPNMSLAKLLKEICKIEGNYKIRLLYLYPDEITDELIDVIASNDKILHYFDIPLQHISSHLLESMHRRGDENFVRELIGKIRNKITDAVIRTTIIVGFPGETEEDQIHLLDFIKDIGFNHLGAFTYSPEEGTVAFSMDNQVPEEIKIERYNELMDAQKYVSLKKNQEFVGSVYSCVIEKYDGEHYYGRGYMLAPDDIDGTIFINSNKELEIGSIYNIRITDAEFYDLIGEVDE